MPKCIRSEDKGNPDRIYNDEFPSAINPYNEADKEKSHWYDMEYEKHDWAFYRITGKKDKCPCDGFKCISKHAKSAKANISKHPYTFYGRNCNTYAYSLLKKCNYKIKPWEPLGLFTGPGGVWF